MLPSYQREGNWNALKRHRNELGTEKRSKIRSKRSKSVPSKFHQRLQGFERMKISLHSFCKDNELPKASVHRKCQELKIDTSEGLSKEDCDRLLVEFGKKAVIEGKPEDISTTAGDIVPVVHEVEVVAADSDLAVRRIQPQVIAYDTTELDASTQLNQETIDFNISAIGSQVIEQMRQLAKLHASQAKQAYAYTIASELADLNMGKSTHHQGDG